MIKKEDPFKKDRLDKCQVCNEKIYVDKFGNGVCEKCKWGQSEDGVHNYQEVRWPNPVSFARAKILFKEGKPMKPNFDEFIEGLVKFLHYEFNYKQKRYGALSGHGNGFEIYEYDVEEGYQSYPTVEEFKEKANINGHLLKDLWNEVENPFYY